MLTLPLSTISPILSSDRTIFLPSAKVKIAELVSGNRFDTKISFLVAFSSEFRTNQPSPINNRKQAAIEMGNHSLLVLFSRKERRSFSKPSLCSSSKSVGFRSDGDVLYLRYQLSTIAFSSGVAVPKLYFSSSSSALFIKVYVWLKLLLFIVKTQK